MKRIAMLLIVLMLVSLVPTGYAVINRTPTTEVTGGLISGYYNDDNTIAIFKGIPYAAPPMDALRWAAPQTVEHWVGVKECVEFGKNEIQAHQVPATDGSMDEMWSYEYYIDTSLGYSEDCLTLNVWAKDDEIAGKPVLVYIHGGGNRTGGSSCPIYDGEYIASQDVVYVSINYRVNIFGYMAHPELTAEQGSSGNYGLKDQIFALEWVRDNIAQFGGDPTNVTVMGQSAGAQNVYSLSVSPLAKGLFDKAVAMSLPTIMQSNPAPLAEYEQTAKENVGGRSLEELRELNGIDVWQLGYSGSICVDGSVLDDSFRKSVASGNENGVTLISGWTANDCDLFAYCDATNVEEFAAFLNGRFGEEAGARLMELYPATDETVGAVANTLLNDSYVILQNAIAQARNAHFDGKTYIYQMTRVMSGPDAERFGAFHSSDVPYTLNYFDDYRADYWTEEDYEYGRIASGWLLSFCKTGAPAIDGVEWSPSTGDAAYMDLNLNCETKTVSGEKAAFWADYYGDLSI